MQPRPLAMPHLVRHCLISKEQPRKATSPQRGCQDDTRPRVGYDWSLITSLGLPMRSILFAFLALVAMAMPAAAQETAIDPRAALYELRVYHAHPGKLDALNAR